MKRLFFLLTGLLLGVTVTAQNIARCEYWFDQDYANRQDAFVVNGSLQWQADATTLSTGLHNLVLHIVDTNGVWSSPLSFMFLHYPSPLSATATYTYWFDEDYANSQSGTLTNGNMLVDASSLTAGLHVFNLMCKIGDDVRIEQHLFMHIPDIASATATYTYWFDDNSASAQSGTLANGSMMADASSLASGVHQITIICQVGTSTRVEQRMFYKLPVATTATNLTFNYSVDNGNYQTATVIAQGTLVNLDLNMVELAEGNHTIIHYITNGNNDILTPLQSDSFVRTHIPDPIYTLTVISADETMGSVTGGGQWVANEEVTISAQPNNGYHFTHWNDGVTDNPRTITITSDTTFTAYFEADIHYYTLTVLSADETMGSVTGGGTFEENEQVTISASPNNGYIFAHWNDDITDNPLTITITSDTTFTAWFAVDHVGFEEISMKDIIAYGHQGYIIVSLDCPRPIWVYDIKGSLIIHKPAEGTVSYSIPVSNGVYIVKAGETFVKKVVVTK